MVQVSYPGVYVQEKSSGVKTITGVSTSIAAFFGRATKGYLNRAVRCLSYADYVRSFGAPHTQSELALSVKQFFDNGGTDCYVVRLASASARRAEVTLQNWANTDVLRAVAKMEGAWGNGVRLEVDYNTPNPGETFNLRVIQEEGGRVVTSETFTNLSMDPASSRHAPSLVSQSSQIIDLSIAASLDLGSGSFDGYSEARRPLGATDTAVHDTFDGLINPPTGTRHHSFDISVDGSAYTTVNLSTLTVPATAALIVTALQDRIGDALAALVPARQVTVGITASTDVAGQQFLRITAATTGGDNASVKVRRSAANDIAANLMLGADNGGEEMARRSDFRPAPTGTVLRIEDGSGALDPLNVFTGLANNALTGITVGSEPAVLLDLVGSGTAGDPMYQDYKAGDTPSGHNDGVRDKLQSIAQAISNAPGTRYKAEVHGYQLVILAKDGTLNEAPASVAFAGSASPALEINTRQYTLGVAGTSGFSGGGVDGNDGGMPDYGDYLGNSVDKTGFYALDAVDLFNLMILPVDYEMPDATRQQLWGPASIYCNARRAFLLVEAPNAWTTTDGRPAIVQNSSQVNDIRTTVVKDYSAIFFPRIRYNDRGIVRAVGPTGAIAGLMARTDASRGVWKAPAGTEADLRGIAGLEVTLTDLENGVLNKLGVNCLRTFPSGFVNWGARTLDGSDDLGSEWKYIPIRRLALFIEESLYRGTQWVVFEPNDEPLWAKIRLNVGVFMNGLFRQGAFQGSTADQAYFVKCDSETTTQADRNLGIVNIEVGFAPLKPAEFVILTIQQIAGDLQ